MSVMSLTTALSIFKLPSNYTEEDLKKRYRELVKENHPDYHLKGSKAEIDRYNRITQDINEAHEILKKNLKTRTNSSYASYTYQSYNQYQKSVDLNVEIVNAKNKIILYLKLCDAIKLMGQVSKLIDEYRIKLNNSRSSGDIRILLLSFKIKLEALYRNYSSIYGEKHNIPEFIIKSIVLNYDCDCAVFFSQLQKCKKILEEDISKLQDEYKSHEHYNILKDEIDKEIEELKKKLYNHNITKQEYNQLLIDCRKKINFIITDYDRRYRSFKRKFNDICPQLDYEIRKEISNNMKEIVKKLGEKNFSDMYKKILEKTKSSKIPKSKDEIFSQLRNRYLSNANPLKDDINSKLFLKAAELLYTKDSNEEILNFISQITFENPEHELEKLINLSSKKVKTYDEFLCIKKSTGNYFYSIHLAQFLFSKNGKNYYSLKNTKPLETIIEESDLNDYIHINDFLSDAIFLGFEKVTYPFTQLLYYDPKSGKIIVRFPKDNRFEVFDESILKKDEYVKSKKSEVYQNKAYLKHEISDFFDREFSKEKIKRKSR